MKKEKKPIKPFLTDKDLVEALLLISEATKTLALEVMLLPQETKEEGGTDDVTNPNNTQQKVQP